MSVKSIITIQGEVSSQYALVHSILLSLDEEEFCLSFSLKGQRNKADLLKFIFESKLWERLIPGFHHLFKVRKSQMDSFLDLLSIFPDSIAIIVQGECLYRSIGNDDISLFPGTQSQCERFVEVVKIMKTEKLVDGFVVENDDYEDPYYLLDL